MPMKAALKSAVRAAPPMSVMMRVRRDPILVDLVGSFTRIHAGPLRHFNAEANQAPPE